MLTIAIFIWAIPQQSIAQIEDNAYEYNDTTYNNSYDDDSYYDDSYDDYTEEYHWEIPCEHAGNQTYWKTLTFKSSLENYNKPGSTEGLVRISDSCIDIDCTAIRMYFGISSHIRITPELYRVFRDRADEIFDVIEIRKGFGPHKGKYILFIGKWTEDEHMTNTTQLICIPTRVNGKRQLELPKNQRAWISAIEQVR